MSGNKQLIVQILFQTKMLCGPQQNTSVAHRWAMALRMKTTVLDCSLSFAHNASPLLVNDCNLIMFLDQSKKTFSIPD